VVFTKTEGTGGDLSSVRGGGASRGKKRIVLLRGGRVETPQSVEWGEGQGYKIPVWYRNERSNLS